MNNMPCRLLIFRILQLPDYSYSEYYASQSTHILLILFMNWPVPIRFSFRLLLRSPFSLLQVSISGFFPSGLVSAAPAELAELSF